MADDDDLVKEAAAAAPAAPGPSVDDPAEAEPAPPDLVRIEFPVRVVVIGGLRQEDIDRVTEAVLAELQDAVESGP